MARPERTGTSRAAAAGGVVRRVGRAWGSLEGEQRTAAVTAIALFVTMFLPWYSRSAVGVVGGRPVKVDDTLTAFGAFSFVEAAILLVAVGVLWMLFARGEGKAFHLPFGDGNVIFAAGLWVCLLVFYRQFDKPSPDSSEGLATSIGVSWGIFVTFLTGLFLAFSGQRLRVAHLAEPPLPGDVAPSDEPLPPGRRRPAAARAQEWEQQRPDTAATRVADPGAGTPRPRPGRDASQTVVDRRGPSVDETVMADVPEYPPVRRRSGPAGEPPVPPPTAPTRLAPADEPTGPTRSVRGEDQLRLGEDRRGDGEDQLRLDGD